jgi:hypothetical protein
MFLYAILFALIVQLLAVAALVFGDIGFDHRGRYGLDFTHGILICGVYLVALTFGVIACIAQRRWIALGAQAIIPLIWMAMVVMPIQNPKLDPVKYQYLMGKSRNEAETELRKYRVQFIGKTDDAEFESYNGMVIYYSPEGRVVAVKAPD